MAENKKKFLFPTLTLFLTAPIFGEVLSTSSPPTEFFQPATFLILVGLYGSGALLVRECVRRWQKGWISVLLLGMAYGIYEEGLVVRSFFDPNWVDIGVLGSYGRMGGINWIWSIALTIFHAVVSIGLPILVVELLFPQHRAESWLGKTGLVITGVVFASFFFFAPLLKLYAIPAGKFLLCLACMAGLILLAYHWKDGWLAVKQKKTAKPGKIGLSGFVWMLLFALEMWLLPALNLPAWLDFCLLAALPWLGVWQMKRWDCTEWSERQQWALAMGLLTPWFITASIAELQNAARADDTRGLIAASLLVLASMLLLRLQIGKREKERE
ncbi:MAG TPA: hypothetical protein PLL88_07395 [Anaerolineaceae bacterium]|nr:hypothetical protein [Anaerolineaceae bacterium]